MMTSFWPRTVRSLPAATSSDGIVLPSAVIEIQDSSRAWITTVNSPGTAAETADPAVPEPMMREAGELGFDESDVCEPEVNEPDLDEGGLGEAEPPAWLTWFDAGLDILPEASPDNGSAGNCVTVV